MPLNCTLTSGKFYVMYSFYQNKKHTRKSHHLIICFYHINAGMIFLWNDILFCLRMCPTKYFPIFFREKYPLPWANQRKEIMGVRDGKKSSLKGPIVKSLNTNNEKNI